MRAEAPFQWDDLCELDMLLASADTVLPMQDIATGKGTPYTIGMRHDVDNHLAPAVAMAEWEAKLGHRSTYFILHTAPYWQDKDTLRAGLETIAECGHEIGFHVNAITKALVTGHDPLEIVEHDLAELRGYGFDVTGVVAHGDQACYLHNFVNDEIFTESSRPDYGPPDRMVGNIQLRPMPRSTFGFEYDPNWLPRSVYLSDSGGRWSRQFEGVANGFPYRGQLHMLIHPDWWAEAFAPERIAA